MAGTRSLGEACQPAPSSTRTACAPGATWAAISDEEPFPLFPDVPPLSRLVPGFDVVGWFALCGQKAMAPELVDRLEAAVRRAMADPSLVRRMAEGGLTPRFEDRATITRRLADDRALWLGVIRAVNLRAS